MSISLKDILPAGYVILGFVLAEGGVWLRARARLSRERRSIASAMFHETVRVGAWFAGHGNSVVLFAASGKDHPLTTFNKFKPPQAGVYENLVARLCDALPDEAGEVIGFQYAVDMVRSWFDGRRGETESSPISKEASRDLAKRWEAACRSAARAIEALRPKAKMQLSDAEEEYIDKLLVDLGKIGTGDVISRSN